MSSSVDESSGSGSGFGLGVDGGGGGLDGVPLERLEVELIAWAGHIAAATARWLRWLAVYDRRGGWEVWGCRSAAHWLSWKCSMSLGTARCHVRVARALEDLPVVAAAFGAGELSFSKVRALTRLALPFDEAEMVETARWATASQLDRLVAGCRQALTDEPGPVPQPVERFRCRGRGDGLVEMVLVVSEVDAERIDNTIAAMSDRLVADRDPGVSVSDHVEGLGGWGEIRAEVATELLTNSADSLGSDPVQLVVEVEAAPTTEDGVEVGGQCATGGRYLPDRVIRRLGCDAVIATPGIDTAAGTGQAGDAVAGVGLRQRVVPYWLRRQLERRDRHCCQFPGCASVRRLHAHHIIHWLDRGPTDLDNLILLCSFHHHLMHEGEWNIEGPAGSHRFLRPDGSLALVLPLTGNPEPVETSNQPATTKPQRTSTSTGTGSGIESDGGSSVASLWDGQPLDLHFAVAVLATNLETPPNQQLNSKYSAAGTGRPAPRGLGSGP